MTDQAIRVIVSSLLHDIGKPIYRSGIKENHSDLGWRYLKEDIKLDDKEILDGVKYHHASNMKSARISDDSIAYIVYCADNIASAIDRRDSEDEDAGFDMHIPLESVFNRLNGNNAKKTLSAKTLRYEDEINYPTEIEKRADKDFYVKIMDNITDSLKGISVKQEYINSLLEILEGNLSYVPSSTNKKEAVDISLFDHVKITAAIASCILEYVNENQISNLKELLYKKSEDFYEQEAFLMYSMDVSGIQDFIYTISSDGALRTLRARSFYIEIMLENIIDNLLEKLNLSRANLLYSGGGHCYILLPNTQNTKSILKEYNDSINSWLLSNFDIALYIAHGYAPCSCNSLKNNPNGSYKTIFRKVSEMISGQKGKRYSAKDIMALNNRKIDDHARECKVCKRISKTNADEKCPMCTAIERFSNDILYSDYFIITYENKENALPLPGEMYLISGNENKLKEKMRNDYKYVRAYSKNHLVSGVHIATNLWVGDYTLGQTTDEMAGIYDGIERIAVLRADVDNLGQTFVSGFDNDKLDNRYVTISRTATLSRQLSMFFKFHINRILSNPEFTLDGTKKEKRNVSICYSGGDDLFLVGNWIDIIESAVDIRRAFEKYTENTLTISAGIGIYGNSYPISVAAKEVALLEDKSKDMPGKNSVTLLEDGKEHVIEGDKLISDGTYSWMEFEKGVIEEKYSCLLEFFENVEDKGNSVMYNMLDLIRGQEEIINFARYVYLLARLEPNPDADSEEKERYKIFSDNMFKWIQPENKKDQRNLKTAMTIYSYAHRQSNVDEEEREV
ncbi:MAG: type III-A CRISPR-associated protein Cas10/Csm1 [Agathobacter sp.]|nr:type III-A CRISPR-associated protein Cas10/Csm1 [Agathobacter sp.]